MVQNGRLIVHAPVPQGGRPNTRAAPVACAELDYTDEQSLEALLCSTRPELSHGQDATSSAASTSSDSNQGFDLVLGSDVIFSETHAALAGGLKRLIRQPDGLGILCLADRRVGTEAFLRACSEEHDLDVELKPFSAAAVSLAIEETGEDELGQDEVGSGERGHTLYFVRHREAGAKRSGAEGVACYEDSSHPL